jgi:hypothetical protein
VTAYGRYIENGLRNGVIFGGEKEKGMCERLNESRYFMKGREQNSGTPEKALENPTGWF